MVPNRPDDKYFSEFILIELTCPLLTHDLWVTKEVLLNAADTFLIKSVTNANTTLGQKTIIKLQEY